MDTENLAESEKIHRLIREGTIESPDEFAMTVLDRIDSNYINATIVLTFFISISQNMSYVAAAIVRLAEMVNTTPEALMKDALSLIDAFDVQVRPKL